MGKTPAQMRELSEEERKRYGLREVTETEASLPGVPANAGEEHFFCRNLTCRRKKLLIFENLNLSLPAGKITALTGRNGAGKTTLAMVLAGLQKQSGGEIYIGGKSCLPGSAEKWCGTVPTTQEPSFYHQRHGGIAAPFRCFLRAAGTCQNIVENTGVVCLQGYTPGCPFWRPEAETFYRLRLVIRKGNPAFRRTHVRAGRGKHAKNRCRIDSSRSRRQNDRGHHP